MQNNYFNYRFESSADLMKRSKLPYRVIFLFALFLSTTNWTTGTQYNPEAAEITTITVDNSELPSNKVNALYVDSSMTLWVGTDMGLASKDTSGEWKNFDTILFSTMVNDIEYERTAYGKELWIATDSGLTVAAYNDVDGVTGSTTYVPENSGMIGRKVSSVAVDERHNRWVGTDSAICVYRGSSWASELGAEDNEDNAAFTFADYKITDIGVYADTVALIATHGEGIVRMSYDQIDGFTGASTWGQPWSQMASNNVSAVDVSAELQWYATDTGANSHTSDMTKEDWKTYNKTTSGIVADNINTVAIDDNNNAWLGTNEGISIIYPDGGVLNYTETDGLLNDTVNYLTTDIAGNIWAATNGGIQSFSGVVGTQVSLGMPGLIAPANNSTGQAISVDLSWSEVQGAESYHLQVATDFNFAETLVDESLEATSYTVAGLDTSKNYFWRVAATNATLTGEWSAKYLFKTGSIIGIDAPSLVSPANNATNQALTVTIDWDAVDGAVDYNVQVATDAAFTNLVVNEAGITATELNVTGLEQETTYYWQVAASNGAVAGAWSTAFSFTTEGPDGISNPQGTMPLSVYPVPFSNQLVIENKAHSQDATITLYSLDGKVQLQAVMVNKQLRLNTSDLQRGVYVLKYTDGIKEYSLRIVK